MNRRLELITRRRRKRHVRTVRSNPVVQIVPAPTFPPVPRRRVEGGRATPVATGAGPSLQQRADQSFPVDWGNRQELVVTPRSAVIRHAVGQGEVAVDRVEIGLGCQHADMNQQVGLGASLRAAGELTALPGQVARSFDPQRGSRLGIKIATQRLGQSFQKRYLSPIHRAVGRILPNRRDNRAAENSRS